MTSGESMPTLAASAADDLRRDHGYRDDHNGRVPANTLDAGHRSSDLQGLSARVNPLAGDQRSPDAQEGHVPGNPLGGGQAATDSQAARAPTDPLLFCAEFLDDVERVRIASENRLRSLAEAGVDVKPYEPMVEGFRALEHQATLQLKRALRQHPLGPWIKATIGIGEKQGARLIAAIGDVYYNHAAGRPRRGPAELWAYCGFAPGQKGRKGVKSNWNATAKMRAFLIAESCIKQRRSPYRAYYDVARTTWAEHDTTDLHKHKHGLRLVAKAVLRDLFLEARRVYGETA